MTGETNSGRLIAYDRRIAVNGLRAIASRWSDLAIAGISLLLGAALLRSGTHGLSPSVLRWGASGLGLVCAMAAGRAMDWRLDFHASDGPFAAEALRGGSRFRYRLAWHAAAFSLAALLALVANPGCVPPLAAGYGLGALLVHIEFAIGAGRLVRLSAPESRFSLQAKLRHPAAAFAGAMVLAVSLALTSSFAKPSDLPVVAALITIMMVFALSGIDDELVRYMSMTGHGSWALLRRQLQPLALFSGLATAIAVIGWGGRAAVLVTAICLTGLMIAALRVHVYSLWGRRIADWLVWLLIMVMALAAYSLPPALPVLLAGLFWQLHRRVRERRWMAL